jgi:hypothetical protein
MALLLCLVCMVAVPMMGCRTVTATPSGSKRHILQDVLDVPVLVADFSAWPEPALDTIIMVNETELPNARIPLSSREVNNYGTCVLGSSEIELLNHTIFNALVRHPAVHNTAGNLACKQAAQVHV